MTGMSGSGKSKALNILEDSGFYCLDNMPVKLFPEFIDMFMRLDEVPEKLCLTMDIRSTDSPAGAVEIIKKLSSANVQLKVLFLDCEDKVLIHRYKESRRLHPLMMYDENLTLETAIAKERKLLEDVRQHADVVVETSLFTVGDLKEKILTVLPDYESTKMQLNFVAFGYKYGIPSDCDLVFDVRCLPNPFYIDELKGKTGDDREVRDYVMSCPESKELMSRITAYLDTALPLYEHEGRSQLVVGLGCTGGQHRSLTFAILLAEHYADKFVTHAQARDRDKNLSLYR